MASQITCDLCGGEYAISMITRLDNGDSLAVGEACQLTFHLTVSRELITATPPELADTYIEQVNALIDAYGQLGAAAGILGAAAADDGISGNESAGALTSADLDQIEAADAAGGQHADTPAERTEDEHAADLPERLDGQGTPAAGRPGSGRRPGRGGVRRSD